MNPRKMFAALLFFFLFGRFTASAQSPAIIPTPKLVADSSLIPRDERVDPMPLEERLRQHAVPARGICSTVPATSTEDGLFSGNGTMNISVYGDPFAEQVLFNDEEILQPWKTGKPLEAPKIADILPEVRKLMLHGEYRKALDLSLDASAKAGVPQGANHPAGHPAFDLRINTLGRHAVTNYLRTLDFATGEVRVVWTDQAGTWERRSFASRPDNVVVQSLTAPTGGALNVDIQLDTSMILRFRPRQVTATPTPPMPYHQDAIVWQPSATEIHFTRNLSSKLDNAELVLEGRYVVESGNPGYAAVTRVLATGGELVTDGDTLHVRGARSLLLLSRIAVFPTDITKPSVDALQRDVEAVVPDYNTLLARHRPQQAEVMGRASLDFGGAAFHAFSGEELLIEQRTRQGFNPALLENLFDMGRYWLYARSGKIFAHLGTHQRQHQSATVRSRHG